MFNDIFGEVLWKGLIVDKPPDPGEIQATRNGNFLMKCRLLRIFNFFSQMSYFTIFGNTYEIYKIFQKCFNYEIIGKSM